jgi:hypothetical protein
MGTGITSAPSTPACEDIFGYVPGDFVDQFIIDFVVPADQDATRK